MGSSRVETGTADTVTAYDEVTDLFTETTAPYGLAVIWYTEEHPGKPVAKTKYMERKLPFSGKQLMSAFPTFEELYDQDLRRGFSSGTSWDIDSLREQEDPSLNDVRTALEEEYGLEMESIISPDAVQ